MLLDQRIVAGLGNIYVCEALFRARIDPRSRRGGVAGRARARWSPSIPAVLEEAIAAGGSTLRDFVSPDGELGYFRKGFAVYGREGEPCGMRRHGQAHRPGRAFDVVLPQVSALGGG